MKIILLCSDGSNQIALANKLCAEVGLSGIVVSKPITKYLGGIQRVKKILKQLEQRTLGAPFAIAWHEMMGNFERYTPTFPDVPTIQVDNINDEENINFLNDVKPDLVLVSGTNLLKKKTIHSIREYGPIMNLHTGISPYVKGGPNCTNWCLAINRFDLIGNTVMWIDVGIDSGSLICTERVVLDRSESLTELHIKVMDHAHDLYIRAVKKYASGESVPNIDQSTIGSGRTFYNREWNAKKMMLAYINFITKFKKNTMVADIKLVNLE